jgi:hypothetical protein
MSKVKVETNDAVVDSFKSSLQLSNGDQHKQVRPKTAAPRQKLTLSPYFDEIHKKLQDSIPVKENQKIASKRDTIKIIPGKGLLEEKLPPPKPCTAHKRYSPVYACANTLLAKKWDDATLRRHREKIKTMKACIDNENSAKASDSRALKKSIAKQGIIDLIRS